MFIRVNWEDGMDVNLTHGNHVSLKWRMEKKKEKEFYQMENVISS